MNDNGHERIRQAIENGYGGLNGDDRLADRIISKTTRSWRMPSLRPLAVTVIMLVLMVGVALALVPQFFSMDNAGSWTYVDNQLLYQGAEAKHPTVVLEAEGIRHMVAEEGTGLLYYITRAQGGGFTLHNTTNYGKELYPNRHINAKYRIQDIDIVSGSLYMLADTTTGSGQLYRLHALDDSIPDELLNVADWENKGTTAFTVDDYTLYAYNAQTQQLAAINLQNRTLLNAPIMAGNLSAIATGYQLEGEQYVLAISEGKLLAIGTTSGKRLDTGVKLPADAATLDSDSYSVHVGDSAGMVVGTYDITDLSGVELRQLYVVDGFAKTAAYEYAEDKMKEKYPDVEIVHRWTNGEIDYKTEMMSGEAGIDIVCFQDYTAFAPMALLLKNGAILDLTDEPSITAVHADYLDVWELVSAGGRQYGVMDTTCATPTLWEVDVKIAEKIGWEVPDGVWTWNDFDQLIDLVITYNQTAEKPIWLLADEGLPGYGFKQFDAIYLDFFSGTSHYDSEEYLGVIRREQKMALHDLKKPYDVRAEELDGNTLLRVQGTSGRQVFKDRDFILPPTFDADDPVYVTSVMPLVVNANTKMKDEAVYFLSCLISVEAESLNNPYFSGQWLKDESLYTAQVDPFILKMEGAGASERNKELLRFVLEHSVPMQRIIEVWQIQVRELLPALQAGEISPEEYAAIVQRQADMILGE